MRNLYAINLQNRNICRTFASDLHKELITTILRIKIERTIILFFFLTIIIMCFYILILNFLSEFSLNPINKIIGELKQINITKN